LQLSYQNLKSVNLKYTSFNFFHFQPFVKFFLLNPIKIFKIPMRLCFFFLKKIINIFKDSGIGIFTNSVNYNQYLNPNIFFSLKKMGVLRILTRFNEKF
jgi:hypothetical protein